MTMLTNNIISTHHVMCSTFALMSQLHKRLKSSLVIVGSWDSFSILLALRIVRCRDPNTRESILIIVSIQTVRL